MKNISFKSVFVVSSVLLLLLISFYLGVPKAKASFSVESYLVTSNFTSALQGSSPLVPAAKPLSGRKAFAQTNSFVAIRNYANTLEAQVKKKVRYKAPTTKKVKGNINTRLANSLKAIKDRRNNSFTRIENLTEHRLENLYEAIEQDYSDSIEKVEFAFSRGVNSAQNIRKNQLRKAQANQRKAAKRKYRNKKIRQRAVRKAKNNFKKRQRAINQAFNQRVRNLNKSYEDANEKIEATYEENSIQAENKASAERNASIRVLNSQTEREVTLRRAQRERLQKAINYLSSGTAGRIGEVSDIQSPAAQKQIRRAQSAKKRAKQAAKRRAKQAAKRRSQAAKKRA